MVYKFSYRWSVLVILTALLSSGCLPSLSQNSDDNEPTPVTVELTSVVALGRIEPRGEVIRLSVSNAADSRVNEIQVQEGDWVEAHQVIAVLQGAERRQADLEAAHALVRQRQAELQQQQTGNVKPAEIEAQQATVERLEAQLSAQTLQRQASVNRAQATLQESQINYERYRQLTDMGATSRSELDTALRNYETAQADLEMTLAEQQETSRTLNAQIVEARARLIELTQVKPEDIAIATAQLEQAQIQVVQRQADLDDVLVRSPVAGQILKINTQIGEQVNTQQGIVELAQTDQMMVIAEVYETDIEKVSVGQSVSITSEYGGVATDLNGTVEQIGLQIGTSSLGDTQETNPTQDINARVVTVKVRLDDNASQQVAALTGMQVRVAIDIKA